MTLDPKPSTPKDFLQKSWSRLFPDKPPESEASPPVPRLAATLGALAQLRVQFLDNAKRPLYPLPSRGASTLSRDEEAVAMSRGLEAIHQAHAAGRILGKSAVGAYEGREAHEVMAQVTVADLRPFLAFVQANPRSFMQRPVRISEAFLAWLVDRGRE